MKTRSITDWETRPDLEKIAYISLRQEITAAILSRPYQKVRTPADGKDFAPAMNCVLELIGPDDEHRVLEELLALAVSCSEFYDERVQTHARLAALHKGAQSILARIAHLHSDYHAADLARDNLQPPPLFPT